MGAFCKTCADRAACAQPGMGNDATSHTNIATGFQKSAVHHALDHDVAARLDFHALQDVAIDLHGAVIVDVAGRHVDFRDPQDWLHHDAAFDPHRLPAHRCQQQVGVVAGHLRARQSGGKRLVASGAGRQHTATDAMADKAGRRRNAAHQRRTRLHRVNAAVLPVVDQAIFIQLGYAVDRLRNHCFKNGVTPVFGADTTGHQHTLADSRLTGPQQCRFVDAEQDARLNQRPLDVFHGDGLAAVRGTQADLGCHFVGRNVDLDRGVTALGQQPLEGALPGVAIVGGTGNGLFVQQAITIPGLSQQGMQCGAVNRQTFWRWLAAQEHLSIRFSEGNVWKVHGL